MRSSELHRGGEDEGNKTAVDGQLDSWPHGRALWKERLRPCRER